MARYIGNGPYCYANAISMLVESAGERVEPSLVEALTGVGLGAFWLRDPRVTFFSNLGTAPDRGTSEALRILGFDFKEHVSQDPGKPPWQELRADLGKSPAILGPLDMGYLTHNPIHGELVGADHFVLAFAMDDREIRFHDPEGFPFSILPLEEMEQAWRAEQIDYRRGHYRYWTRPERVRRPTEQEVHDAALAYFARTYRESEKWASQGDWILDGQAIRIFADDVRKGEPTGRQIGHMQFFAFKLGARRALDYATFFESRDKELSSFKGDQADLFGRCHVWAARRDWSAVADGLRQVAEVEDAFRSALFAR